VVERRQGSDDSHHDGHRVGVMSEALVELNELLVHKGVSGDLCRKLLLLDLRRQLTVQQQVAGVHEPSILSKLLNGVPATTKPRHSWTNSQTRRVEVGPTGESHSGTSSTQAAAASHGGGSKQDSHPL
jgi:hypothetical protein